MMQRAVFHVCRHRTAALVQVGQALSEVRCARGVPHGLAALLILREAPIRRRSASRKKSHQEGTRYG